MITERTLRKWRKDALKVEANFDASNYENLVPNLAASYEECQARILRLTQELLDQHLLRK